MSNIHSITFLSFSFLSRSKVFLWFNLLLYLKYSSVGGAVRAMEKDSDIIENVLG